MAAIQPLERYVFTPCETTYPSLAGDESLTGPLVIPESGAVDCGVTSGIFSTQDSTALDNTNAPPSIAITETSESMAVFQTHFQETNPTGLSISLWIKPSADISSVVQPILTAGSKTLQSDGFDGCTGHDVAIWQYRGQILLSYTDNDAARSCRQLRIRSATLLDPLVLTHVAVVWSSSQTSVFINGLAVVDGAPNDFDTTLSNWDPSGSWQVLGNYQTDQVFTGSVLQFSLLDRDLSLEQVKTIFEQGLVVVEPQEPPVLTAQTSNVSILQGSTEPVEIPLGSTTVSTARLPLMAEILSLPRQGTLSVVGNGTSTTTLSVSSVIPLPNNSSELAIEYTLLSEEYFNAPSINGYNVDLLLEPEIFTYRLVTFGVTQDNIVAASPPVTQALNVVHINHRPTLIAPPLAMTTTTLSTDQESSEKIIMGIQLVDDLDFSIDRVRVDAFSSSGQLTLNSANRFKADFSSCSDRTFSAWQCVGDGVLDRSMTFAALPGDVAGIFADLRYKSLNQGSEDVISIKVSDGAGGLCLSLQEHEAFSVGLGNSITTVHQECFQVEAEILIPASTLDKKDGGDESGVFGIPNTDFKNFGLADFLFWSLVIVVLASVFTCMRKCFRCLARGKAVIPDDVNYPQDLDISSREFSSSDDDEPPPVDVETEEP